MCVGFSLYLVPLLHSPAHFSYNIHIYDFGLGLYGCCCCCCCCSLILDVVVSLWFNKVFHLSCVLLSFSVAQCDMHLSVRAGTLYMHMLVCAYIRLALCNARTVFVHYTESAQLAKYESERAPSLFFVCFTNITVSAVVKENKRE